MKHVITLCLALLLVGCASRSAQRLEKTLTTPSRKPLPVLSEDRMLELRFAIDLANYPISRGELIKQLGGRESVASCCFVMSNTSGSVRCIETLSITDEAPSNGRYYIELEFAHEPEEGAPVDSIPVIDARLVFVSPLGGTFVAEKTRPVSSSRQRQ